MSAFRRLILITSLIWCQIAYSQERNVDFRVYFLVNKSDIDLNVGENRDNLMQMKSFLNRINTDSTFCVKQVFLYGSASPEGREYLNKELAHKRMEAMTNIIQNTVSIPDSAFTRSYTYTKEDFVSRAMDKMRYEDLRYAQVSFVIEPIAIPSLPEPVQHLAFAVPSEPMQIKNVDRPVNLPDWNRHLTLKTNALGLGMGISNIACEIDICKHLSLSIPVYYSALNYFKQSIKFRTLATQPELRFWPKKDNNGFFLGLHGGVAQYNIAVDGELRYQDHNGTSPALGGGLGLGYRLPMSKNGKWQIEFALGAGAYKLKYDTFYNVDNGNYIDTYDTIYIGIDNAAINISYQFDLKKRKK